MVLHIGNVGPFRVTRGENDEIGHGWDESGRGISKRQQRILSI